MNLCRSGRVFLILRKKGKELKKDLDFLYGITYNRRTNSKTVHILS